MARNVLESIRLLATSCDELRARSASTGSSPTWSACTELSEKNLSVVTALVPAIGYDKSAELAKKALKEDRPLREVVKEAGLIPRRARSTASSTIKAMTKGGMR